ncbi:MAG: error-prone DNA polymerase [Geminicoccaceae bacterium]
MPPAHAGSPAYAELQATSNFSFLRGASHPEELVAQARALGLAGLALTDRNSLAGVVRAHAAAAELKLRFVVGCRLDLACGTSFLCWPTDRPAYARLSSLLTLGKRRAGKGRCALRLADVLEHAAGQLLALLAPEQVEASFADRLDGLARRLPGQLYLALGHHLAGDDAARLDRLMGLARRAGVPPLATNDVHYHVPARRPLQDVLACIRARTTLDQAGGLLFPNAERHLKPPAAMARLFAAWPEALASSLEILERCRFALTDLAYDYPVRDSYDGRTPDEELARRAWTGAAWRYPDDLPEKVRTTIARELDLIGRLRYAPYFLTVHDIVRYAESEQILCQGRGSAANSAVCYVLGITAIDPARIDLLFERFVSAERDEPPDIDVDFEHEQRERVIQHVLTTYGHAHAALVAVVICYRLRSALREVARAMGLSPDLQATLSRTVRSLDPAGTLVADLRAAGLDPADPTLRRTLALARELLGFPRHLSQHPGGFVITRSPLHELVPIEPAAMPRRAVVEWDKDDLAALRMLKIDLLALGMLSCIRRAFALLRDHHGRELALAGIPEDDPAVYAMLSAADTVGVFQVESRAQMSMLPRLKPNCFYDLVIEVAIVRPGPIQGDMVHPYLRRREGKEVPDLPSQELREVLGKTLGVPLFQEQAMRIAIVAAGFTPAQADGLRRAMAAFRRAGTLERYRAMFVDGMVERGYQRSFALACWRQIEGFGSYGFPESHAASFALLAYVSAWLKCHHPDVFCAALLNAQPMGFYAPAQLVRDAREHGVEVRAPDVNHSCWDTTLEPLAIAGRLRTAVRLGLRQIKGLGRQAAQAIVDRRCQPYRTLEELQRRAGLDRTTLVTLAAADACRSLGLDRRHALWAAQAIHDVPLPLLEHAMAVAGPGSNLPPLAGGAEETAPHLPEMGLGEQVLEDYATLRLSLKAHPLALLRDRLAGRGIVTARALGQDGIGPRASVCGLVLVRQRPGSAKGVVFVTLEDETGCINLVVWPQIFERYRTTLVTARLLAARGTLQCESGVIHLIVERPFDLTPALRRLRDDAHDSRLRGSLAKAGSARPAAPDLRHVLPDGRNFR